MTAPDDEAGWVDGDAGPFVRPYAMTRGRTHTSTGSFDLIALVASTSPDGAGHDLQPEQLTILRLCQRPLSVAEISAHLHLPLGTVRVLLDDLLGAGLILTGGPRPADQQRHILREVMSGLRAL